MKQHDKNVWKWCSDCTIAKVHAQTGENKAAVCPNCYLRYEEIRLRKEAKKKEREEGT